MRGRIARAGVLPDERPLVRSSDIALLGRKRPESISVNVEQHDDALLTAPFAPAFGKPFGAAFALALREAFALAYGLGFGFLAEAVIRRAITD